MGDETFYTSIAPWYDRIFPPSRARRDYLLSLLPTGGGRFLDLGCATGALMAQLAEAGHAVGGLDLDPGLVDRARERLSGLEPTLLAVADMREVDRLVPPRSVDLAGCFGNTLVHLASREELIDFFRAVAGRLLPGGRFAGQIVNYDRVMAMARPGLPPVEGDGLRFERDYALRPDGRLDFRTRLLVREREDAIENVVPLLPLTRDALEEGLAEAGFEERRFWGDWARTLWLPGSGPTIWEARNPEDG